MKRSKAILTIELVVLMIGVAVFVPQVIARSQSHGCSDAVSSQAEIALDYARQRLWNDFLDSRDAMFEHHVLPEPSLEEYMYFLNGNGLYRKGDQVMIPVLPPISSDGKPDRLRIELNHTTLPVQLRVSLQNPDYEYELIGQIEVFVESDGSMGLTSNVIGEPKSDLLSYWPVRPGALLP